MNRLCQPISAEAFDFFYAGVEPDASTKENYIDWFGRCLYAYILIVSFVLVLMSFVTLWFSFVYPPNFSTPLSFSTVGATFTAFSGLAGFHRHLIPVQHTPPEAGTRAIIQFAGALLATGLLFVTYGQTGAETDLLGIVVIGGTIALIILSAYWHCIEHEQRRTILEYESAETDSKQLLIAAVRRTLGLTGFFLILSAGVLDFVGTQLLLGDQPGGVLLGICLLLAALYVFGLSVRVFALNQTVSISFRFISGGFVRNITVIFQVTLLMTIFFLLIFGNSYLLTEFLTPAPVSDPFTNQSDFIFGGIVLLIELWLLSSVLFTPYFTVVDGGFIGPFKSSYRLSKGCRINVLKHASSSILIGLVMGLVLLLPASVIIGILPAVVPQRLPLIFLESAIIFCIASFAELFRRLRAAERAE